jgi:hypothetical protein
MPMFRSKLEGNFLEIVATYLLLDYSFNGSKIGGGGGGSGGAVFFNVGYFNKF